MTSKYCSLFDELQYFFTFLPASKQKNALEKKYSQIAEDLALTEKSFHAKNSIQDKKITKITKQYADHYYRVRLYELSKALLPIFYKQRGKNLLKELSAFQLRLLNGLQYSFHHQEPLKNPYPSYLFFSQNYHADHFSNKSHREGVSNETLTEVVEKIKKEELPEDYLRVQIFFAPYENKLHPFTYNNRTWVVFSQSKELPSRIVPILPTKDLLNRITALKTLSNPNLISEETNSDAATPAIKNETCSLLPGPRASWN